MFDSLPTWYFALPMAMPVILIVIAFIPPFIAFLVIRCVFSKRQRAKPEPWFRPCTAFGRRLGDDEYSRKLFDEDMEMYFVEKAEDMTVIVNKKIAAHEKIDVPRLHAKSAAAKDAKASTTQQPKTPTTPQPKASTTQQPKTPTTAQPKASTTQQPKTPTTAQPKVSTTKQQS